MGLRTMKVGTQRRFIVPPALGPPVGPSTFFSAKQCEVSRVVGGGLVTGCVWLRQGHVTCDWLKPYSTETNFACLTLPGVLSG